MQTKKKPQDKLLPSSFRDPSGVVFKRDGLIYRGINKSYKENYDTLINSKLYDYLIENKLLIPHQEIKDQSHYYKIIKPELIPFISYPYEWSFSQLKQAALTTLNIQKKALEFEMSLKDSSAYNIQFLKGRPILIDTLSFEKYNEGQPWVGYRQFCQHFLAPLALMSYKDLRLNLLGRSYIDGIPLDFASCLLPKKTYFNFSILTHIHLHAKSHKKYLNTKSMQSKNYFVSQHSLLGLIDSLKTAVNNLKYKFKGSVWGDYYLDTNYSKESFEQKKQIIKKILKMIKPKIVWDIGANTGLFSRIASNLNIQTLSIDSDPEAIEKNYRDCMQRKEENILPLIIDLANPSSPSGWDNMERMNLTERGPADMVFALALIHHLAIANNLPLYKIASYLKTLCKYLIIEFVPKNDSNAERLLIFREDIFPDYSIENFTKEFKKFFNIKSFQKIRGCGRVLFLMERK